MPPRKGWAAVYCRLSKEDEEKTARESESIRNQRALLLAWAADHGYRAAALEQLCHGILAPHKGIGALGALRRLLAGESFHSILHLACKIGHKPTVTDYAL